MPSTHHNDHQLTTPITGVARDRVTGVDIRIDRIGRGPTVIFLNGLLGLNEHWFGCLPPIARVAECLLVQPPLLEMKGKGCSVDGVVHLVVSVLDTLIDGPVIFVGNSLGGHISLRIAMEHPDLVRGLVLTGSSGLFERTFERDVQHSPSREWLQRKIDALFHDPARMLPGTVDMAYEELSRRSAARALVKLGKSAKRDHLGERLSEVRVPTQLIWGRQDIVTPPEVADQFLDLIPNARLTWIDNCGHAPQIECAEQFGAIAAGFINELNAQASQSEADSEVA
ncbi:MAG: alpha/beta hydrolase [Phycisphaerales bacterium]|nr:alpha/beta hydrolase [Phycisphaerales bacterium]